MKSRPTTFLKAIPFVVFLTASMGVVWFVVSQNGSYIYPLDDAYIHMSIAKNFVKESVWGVTSHGFSSSSSSPVYTLLMSLFFFLFGVNDLIPLVVNFILGLLFILVIWRNLKETSYWLKVAFTTSLVVFIPIFSFAITGMEHLLHTFLTLLFFIEIQKVILGKDSKNLYLFLIVFLLPLVRYESLFFIFPTILALLSVKRTEQTALIFIASASSVSLYGLISILKGGYFLPNSLLIKGRINPSLADYVTTSFQAFFDAPVMFFLFLVLMFIAILELKWKQKGRWINAIIPIIATITIFTHATLARFGSIYRYEGYLVAIFLFVVLSFFTRNLQARLLSFREKTVYISILVLLLIGFGKRAAETLRMHKYASKNIAEQQIHFSEFLSKYYNNASIVLNDIGAASYYTDAKILDLVGLGSNEVIEHKRNKAMQFSAFVEKAITDGDYSIAILYESWFENRLPNNFIKVAQWTISDNVVCGDSVVTFYAFSEKRAEELARNLQEFTENQTNKFQTKRYYD